LSGGDARRRVTVGRVRVGEGEELVEMKARLVRNVGPA
jgi:hypothetical protein